jgi:transcriptional regulator with XRE-family HTH domain
MEYGQRIKSARVACGFTQTMLADRLGLTRSSVANIEAGRQVSTVEQAMNIAAALSIDPRWLLTGWGPTHAGPKPTALPQSVLSRAASSLRKIADSLTPVSNLTDDEPVLPAPGETGVADDE